MNQELVLAAGLNIIIRMIVYWCWEYWINGFAVLMESLCVMVCDWLVWLIVENATIDFIFLYVLIIIYGYLVDEYWIDYFIVGIIEINGHHVLFVFFGI